MRSFFYNNGLSIALLAVFAFSMVGQYLTGWHVYADNELQHGNIPVGLLGYLAEGHFLEAVFENWESEFLQMAAYVVFTISLYQKGSSESKRPGVTDRVDIILPDSKNDPKMPGPVRAGGWKLKLYENSLSLALILLFIASFAIHVIAGAEHFSSEQLEHGQAPVSAIEYLGTSQLWFESFQNWQSEFLSIAVMVILSIYLRQRGSPESKPVDSPHSETGTA